jgi:predicted deacetylase
VRFSRFAAPPLVVSIHDVAPATAPQTRRWLADLDRRGLPAVLLVVPGPWRGLPLGEAPEFAAELRRAAESGHELALHGWSHTAQPGANRSRRAIGALAARGAGEFWTLDFEQADARIARGRAALHAAGIHATGFVPPGYLASPGTRRALAASGLRYWTSHMAVHDLRAGLRTAAPAFSHRPAANQAGSPVSERVGKNLLRQAGRWTPRTGYPLRLALHPDDLSRPGLRETTLTAIDRALAGGATAMTYAQLLDRLRGPLATAGPR